MRQSGHSPTAFTEVLQTEHYPPIDCPLIVLSKQFSSRTRTGPHNHDRGQLMFAQKGFVVANTSAGTWFVPSGHALWMPAGLTHDVSMHSEVHMLAAYIDPAEAAGLPTQAQVLRVKELLAAALQELADEPVGRTRIERAQHLTWLVLDEIARAPASAFILPLPEDARLARVTHALITDPGSNRTIDQWCDLAGLSRRTMTRLFRSQTGLSFADWRCRLRLIGAITRVAEGEPLARVAASLSYRNPAAFRAMAARYDAANLLLPRPRQPE